MVSVLGERTKRSISDPRDIRSRPADRSLEDGLYVFVRGSTGEIFVLPDGPHLHPRILGLGKPASYAGDMTIRGGRILDLTNLSGTFQFSDSEGSLAVADELVRIGFVVEEKAVRFFPADGSRPRVLR